MNNPSGQYTEDGMTEANLSQQPKVKRLVSITEAAKINNVTRQAIYVAIKQNKLKASKDSTRWTIDLNDLEEYRRQKYSRAKSMFNGELLFDNKRGFPQACCRSQV